MVWCYNWEICCKYFENIEILKLVSLLMILFNNIFVFKIVQSLFKMIYVIFYLFIFEK